MFHWDTQVRYSETDENGYLTVPGLINYLQDSCSFQSEELGVGVAFLDQHECAWVISGWLIEIFQMPRFTEKIDVQTWPYHFQGFYGHRNFRICDASGKCMVRANSLWVQISTKTGRPVRVLDELTRVYPMGDPLDMEDAPRKMHLSDPELAQALEPITVQHHHLDSNHHVNNGQYVQIAEECSQAALQNAQESTVDSIAEQEQGMLRKIRVQYKKAAVLGSVIYPYVLCSKDCVQVELSDENRVPYAMVEIWED